MADETTAVEVKPGNTTSEWWLTARVVIALIVIALSAVAASGLLSPDHLVTKIISGVVAVASTLGLGHVTSTYTKTRGAVKAASTMKSE